MLCLIIISFIPDENFCQQLHCSAFVDTVAGTRLAKNLDWVFGNGIVVYNPAHEMKSSVTCIDNGLKWSSKFSSITFNHLGDRMPLGGMNETGLVVEELSTWPVDYPLKKSCCLNELEWIQYQLDSFSSAEEVIENAGDACIDKFLFGIHYIIADKGGNIAIIEFINGEAKVYSGINLPKPVVTNNNYSEQLRYYNLFEEGDLKIHDIENSQDRFIKLLQLTDISDAAAGLSCKKMLNILDSVSVADTRWSIVYDTKNLEIYFKTNLSDSVRSIAFSDFANSSQKMFANFYHKDNLQFNCLTKEKNQIYLTDFRNDIFETDPGDNSGMAGKIDLLLRRAEGQ
jgi:choloylglycine hydrolase